MKKLRLTMLTAMLLLASTVALSSCQEPLDEESPNQTISAKIQWSGTSAPRALLRSSAERDAAPPSFVSSYYEYTSIGNKICSLTPSTFKVALQAVELANVNEYIHPVPFHQFDEENNTWIMQYGDFTTPLAATPEGEIKAGTYSDFMIFFFSGPGVMGMSSTPDVFAESSPVIVVDLPEGYENYVATDVPFKYDGTSTVTPGGNTFYTKKIVDSNNSIFQFSLSELYPKDASGNEMALEVFNFTGTEYKVYAPGIDGVPETYDILDYKDTPGMGILGSNIFTKVPWDGITILPETASVTFTLTWNLDGILELYDNKTSDVTDDILVLADRFWERLSFSAVQYDINGNQL